MLAYLMVRTRGEPLDVLSGIRRAVARVDRSLPLYDVSAMDRYRAESILRERVSAQFMLGFAAFGLLLAALGIYAVIAFSVGQRTGEIGIRLALGARAEDILPLLLGRGVALVAAGLLVGVPLSLALGRLLVLRLPGITPMDSLSLIIAVALVALTATAACLVPSWKASRLAPLRALAG